MPRLLTLGTGLQLVWPGLVRWMARLQLGPFGVLQFHFDNMKRFIRAAVDEHKATLDERNPRDYIDSYLIEINKRSKQTNDLSYFSGE